jgi:molybdenum cofactor synthesis domain-containing protein
MTRVAEIVIIGNEILSGKVPDDNGPFLVREFRALGVRLDRITVIPDHVPTIAATVAEASKRAVFVITTGGVGPTLDDLTFEGVAGAFQVPLRRFDEMAAIISAFFGKKTTEAHMKMAHLPAESELVFSEGLLFPVVRVRNAYVFPGSPELLRKKFLAIRERFREAPFVLRRVFTRLEEGQISDTLDRVHAAVPSVAIGSYPLLDTTRYAVQITLESKDGAEVDRALQVLLSLLDPASIVNIE